MNLCQIKLHTDTELLASACASVMSSDWRMTVHVAEIFQMVHITYAKSGLPPLTDRFPCAALERSCLFHGWNTRNVSENKNVVQIFICFLKHLGSCTCNPEVCCGIWSYTVNSFCREAMWDGLKSRMIFIINVYSRLKIFSRSSDKSLFAILRNVSVLCVGIKAETNHKHVLPPIHSQTPRQKHHIALAHYSRLGGAFIYSHSLQDNCWLWVYLLIYISPFMWHPADPRVVLNCGSNVCRPDTGK